MHGYNGYKDCNKFKEAKNRRKKRYYTKHAIGKEHRYKRYNEEEIQLILKHEMTDVELSKILGRSVEAIQIKRSNLKKERGVK